ncbi:hypothetical protein AVEN_74987-1 [Araneus ventricosus]|uniref:Retrotransposon gag domain-containing protein n=1 Tax=Araneus ventricosus TaxID=182803 RepID=A0A4Y2UWK9_ARAVE|nr:hypothetical protein AVEN_74987-1 [Araneus ventricosus]
MESLAPPPPFRLNSNHVESWKLWKLRFQLYMDATLLNAKSESQKVAILLHVIGEECLEIYNTIDEVSSASMNDILAKFEAYFVPQRNITYERQRLFLLMQREGQSLDDFITELRKQLRNCDYGSLSDSVLVDQNVRGLCESRLRERLLRVPDLDIKKAVDMCRAAETSMLQTQVYFTEERSIDAIKRSKPSPDVKPIATGQANKFRQPAKRQESSGRKCRYCGRRHVPGRCPAYGLTASADKLGLIRKCNNVNSVNCCKSISNLLCKYNQVFERLGNLPGRYRITLCENSVPVVSVTRKVAFSLLEPLKAELDRMVKARVIEKVTEPTNWVSPLVIVQKKNASLFGPPKLE